MRLVQRKHGTYQIILYNSSHEGQIQIKMRNIAFMQ